jgi:hypothetical protein
LTTNNESEKEEHTQQRGKEGDMAKIDITKTELVWPGKYNEDGTPRKIGTIRCFHWPEDRPLL